MSTKFYNISAVGPSLRLGKGGPLVENIGGIVQINGKTVITATGGLPGANGDILFHGSSGELSAITALSFDQAQKTLKIDNAKIFVDGDGDTNLSSFKPDGSVGLIPTGNGSVYSITKELFVKLPRRTTGTINGEGSLYFGDNVDYSCYISMDRPNGGDLNTIFIATSNDDSTTATSTYRNMFKTSTTSGNSEIKMEQYSFDGTNTETAAISLSTNSGSMLNHIRLNMSGQHSTYMNSVGISEFTVGGTGATLPANYTRITQNQASMFLTAVAPGTSTQISLTDTNISLVATGNITINKAPTTDMAIANKKYVDDTVSAVIAGSLNLTSLITLTGMSAGSTNLGAFTGATIPDNQTIKAALQSLETAHEEVDQNVNDVITLTGVAENATNLGTFTGVTITDNQTIKAALQLLETAHEEVDQNVNDLITLSGVAENANNLGTFTGTTIADSSSVKSALQSLETAVETKLNSSAKGVANGVASLDGSGKVPVSQLPSAIMSYEGVWNAATNDPALIDGTGDAGQVYRVSTAGTQDLGSGSITFSVGDYIIYNSAGNWEKSDTTDSVVSVNGMTGIITINTDNVAEGTTNKYYTDTRARTAVISSTISNGDTTHAPSGDAVFDALALKSDLSVVNNLVTLSGVSVNSTNLGTFTGTTIADSSTVKSALQSLETAVETKGNSIGSIRAVSAIIPAANGVTNIGSALPDNSIVVSCSVNVITAYDGVTPELKVGVTGDLSGVASVDHTDIAATGLNFVRAHKDVGTTNKQLMATISRVSGGGSLGSASIIIEYYVMS